MECLSCKQKSSLISISSCEAPTCMCCLSEAVERGTRCHHGCSFITTFVKDSVVTFSELSKKPIIMFYDNLYVQEDVIDRVSVFLQRRPPSRLLIAIQNVPKTPHIFQFTQQQITNASQPYVLPVQPFPTVPTNQIPFPPPQPYQQRPAPMPTCPLCIRQCPDLSMHMVTVHFACSRCGKPHRSQNELLAHETEHTSQCACGTLWPNMYLMAEHAKYCPKLPAVHPSCGLCRAQFHYQQQLDAHLEICKVRGSRYQCKCGRMFLADEFRARCQQLHEEFVV